MGSFRTLLVELSKDPAMIIWLDNQDNHKGAINENFGRELLELFSMGVGNYSEEDIKECARAFTGWTIANREYMELRSQRDSDFPYGRISWHFEYRPEDHDDGEKEFLGQRGRFNGEDVIDIICQQPATARFVAGTCIASSWPTNRGCPRWPYTPPLTLKRLSSSLKPTSIATTTSAQCCGCCSMLISFKSKSAWYSKVKSRWSW